MNDNGQSELNEEDVDAFCKSAGGDFRSFTDAERISTHLTNVLSVFYRLFSDKEKYNVELIKESISPLFSELQGGLEDITASLTTNLEGGWIFSMKLSSGTHIPLWNSFHSLYTYLDLCKFVTAAVAYMVTENKKRAIVGHAWLLDRSETLKRENQELQKACVRSAEDLRAKLKEESFIQQLQEAVLPRPRNGEDEDKIAEELRKLEAELDTKWTLRSVQESWIEGLEGIIRLKAA